MEWHFRSKLHLWPKSLLTLGGVYDHVRYDTKYDIQDGHDAQGFGVHALLQQLLRPDIQLRAESTVSQLFDNYNAGIDWMWGSTQRTVLSSALTSGYTQDHTTERNFWTTGINLNIAWDTPVPKGKVDHPHFAEPQSSAEELINWVQKPAVRMPDVLAIADERISTQAFVPVNGLCPSGPNVTYNASLHQYQGAGGWFQVYPAGQVTQSPFPTAYDSANVMGNPSGAIYCLYDLAGSSTNTVILANNTFRHAVPIGTNWLTNHPSKFWPSGVSLPSFTAPAVPANGTFQTVPG